jgi:hypothetical protein
MYRHVLFGLALAGIIAGFRTLLIPRQPDPDLIRLAVRATLHAMPTSTPIVVEVTRVVEITAIPTQTATPSPMPSDTPTPTITPTYIDTPTPDSDIQTRSQPAEPIQNEIAAASIASDIAKPLSSSSCPGSSDNSYALIPVIGGTIDHPDHLHGDLNLSLRGYVPVNAAPELVGIAGPTDSDPPQLNALLPGHSNAALAATYRVYDWEWSCGEHGCRGGELGGIEVSLLGIAVTPGLAISIPSRRAQIYRGGFVALVVFADVSRITLVYTREDSVANGYSVHLENICVDASLLQAYRSANQAGRGSLPGVRNGQIIGVAAGDEIAVAVRDRGSFTDPRSRKDWWHSGN